MAHVALPIAADMLHQSFTVELDGAVYGFCFRFNTRGNCWMMSLYSVDGAALATGLAVRLGVDLLDRYSDERFPAGRLFALNMVDAYAEPDRDNFGRDVALVYEEA